MKTLRHMTVLAFAGFLAFQPAQGYGPDRIGGYDFSYAVSGDQRVRPVQVFDDGRFTYFQFRAGEPIPAIFSETSAGATLLMPQLEGPYTKVPTIASGYLLRLGHGSGRVVYNGGVGAQEGRALPASLTAASPVEKAASGSGSAWPTPSHGSGAVQAAIPQQKMARLLAASQMVTGLPREMFAEPPARISLETNSYATPLRGDTVEWSPPVERWKEHSFVFVTDSARLTPAAQKLVREVVASARAGSRFEVIGRDDDGHKERVADLRAANIVAAIIAAGIPKSAVSQKTTAEVRAAGKGLWIGVSLRVHDAPAIAGTGGMREQEVAAVVRRLQTGSISPSEALALLGAIKSAPAAMGGAAQPTSPVGPSTWTIRKTDENIERMLERWGREAGWRVLWQGAPAVAITGDSSLQRPDFLQAADYVINQAKGAGYRIRATAYSNQTLVISGE